MTGVTVSNLDGRTLAVKQAADHPDAEARLRTEAELLTRLDHPGVVQLVELDEGPPVRLLTAFVGPDSWARQAPADPAEITEGLAKVVSIVADLHDLGLAHGAIRAEHVLVGGDGRPVLCGLADAISDSEDALIDDCVALAELIRTLDAHNSDPGRGELETVARRLETGGGARAATHQLDALSRPNPSVADTTSRPSPRILAFTAVVVLAVAGVVALGTANSGQPVAGAGPVAETAPVASPIPVPPHPDEEATPPPSSSPDPPAPSVDLDAPVLVHQGRRYGIGAPGDLTVVGDWTCTGASTPALLRPSTGEVAVFASWPTPEEAVDATFLVVVDGAESLEVDANTGCDLLRARTRRGSQIITPEFP